jgi:hypothetical protein
MQGSSAHPLCHPLPCLYALLEWMPSCPDGPRSTQALALALPCLSPLSPSCSAMAASLAPWPSLLLRRPTAPSHRSYIRTHRRLRLISLHPARTLAWALGHRSTATDAAAGACRRRGCGHLWTRGDPVVLPRPSVAAGMASCGRNSEPRHPPSSNRVKDLQQQFDESEGSFCEVHDSYE